MGKTISLARAGHGLRGLIALTAALSLPASAQIAAPETTPTTQLSPEELADYGQSQDVALGTRDGRMTVLVAVAGSGPYPFVIDTGAERTVLSRELADRLRLREAARVTIHGVANTEEARAVHVPSVRVGSSDVVLEQAPLFEERDIGAAGLLGVDALSHQRVLIDFKAGRISVSPSSDPIERSDGQTIVVQALSYHGRLMFKHALAGNRKTMMVIDTGSQYSIGNLALLSKLGRHVDLEQTPVMIETVTGKQVMARIGKIDEILIDGVRLTDMYVAFADATAFGALGLGAKPALLLGMNVMRAFDRVSIDFAQRRVRFTFPREDSDNAVRLASRDGSTRYSLR